MRSLPASSTTPPTPHRRLPQSNGPDRDAPRPSSRSAAWVVRRTYEPAPYCPGGCALDRPRPEPLSALEQLGLGGGELLVGEDALCLEVSQLLQLVGQAVRRRFSRRRRVRRRWWRVLRRLLRVFDGLLWLLGLISRLLAPGHIARHRRGGAGDDRCAGGHSKKSWHDVDLSF